jgi:hypothetical protein
MSVTYREIGCARSCHSVKHIVGLPRLRKLISVACTQSQQSKQSDPSLRTRTMLATDGLIQSLNLQTCALSSCSGCKWPLRRTNHGSADTPLAKTVTQTEKYLGDIFHAKGGNILLLRPSLLGNIEFCSFSGNPNLPSGPQRHSLARGSHEMP